MGISDSVIIPQQINFLDNLIRDGFIKKNEVFSVAHLGNEMDNGTTKHYKKIFPQAQHDLYDIVLQNWDMNSEWNIENYDIVVCHRTTVFVEHMDMFFKELKNCISNNKYILFDFTSHKGMKFDLRNLGDVDEKILPDGFMSETWSKRNRAHGSTLVENPVMSDTVTEDIFKENGVMPLVCEVQFNSIRPALLHYLFWKHE